MFMIKKIYFLDFNLHTSPLQKKNFSNLRGYILMLQVDSQNSLSRSNISKYCQMAVQYLVQQSSAMIYRLPSL